ncbi:MAG: D-alanyl-D-alanine carboxypeptidase family protein [Gammaproteobacteria bacterium]|nr:MAG: D-alanyl-D-alanine carboxypeptidase family protein [Gammaproteobacteria bacterium]
MRTSPGAIGLLALLLFCTAATAALPTVPPPPEIAAKSYVLIDFATGKVLAARDENTRMEPASLTKLMTAYAVYKALQAGAVKITDDVRVSEHAWRTGGAGSGGSTTMLPINSSAPMEVMLKGMIIQSGNDASIALAEHVSGSEDAFSDVMNQHAQELGMTNSHFVNSTGLPHPDHYTSAADIAKLSRAIIAEFPEHYRWYSEKEFVFNNIRQGNRNLLLYRDPTVDGIKTGHTQSAGYCLAASAKRDDMRLISVVMAMESEQARAKASQELLNYGFRFYETRRVQQAGEQIAQSRVWKGVAETVGLGVNADLWLTIPRGTADQLSSKPEAPRDLIAPVAQGQPVGSLRIELAGEPLAETPLVALAAVEEGSLWRQAVDTALLWFE